MRDFEGRTALVTGAASGIGRAMARGFAERGAAVVCFDQAEGVRAVADEIISAGGHAKAIVGDAASEADLDGAVEAAEGLGEFAFCMANAGVSGGLEGMKELTAANWERILRVNLIGPFLLIQRVSPRMAARGRGSIVCTASVAGLRFGAGGIPYSASKAGVISLVQTCANHLAGTGVRVNAICPGLTETGMTQPTFDRARERGSAHKLGQLNPLRRAAAPEEAAALAIFLASDAASYVNGQAIAVDGGLSSSHPTVPGKMA